MKNHIGKVMHFDELAFQQNLIKYTPIIKEVANFKSIYESLDPAYKFTNEVWQSVLANGLAQICGDYNILVAEQLMSAKLTAKALVEAMEENTRNNLLELSNALEAVKTVALGSPGQRVWTIDLKFIIIEEGKIILSKLGETTIRDVFEYKIVSAVDNEFYNHLLNLQNAYQALREFTLINTSFEAAQNLIGLTSRDLLHENENYDGLMVINSKVLGFLKPKTDNGN